MKKRWSWLATLMVGLCFFSFYAMAEEMEDNMAGVGETHKSVISASSGGLRLPADTLIIEDNAFSGCTSLKGNLILPDTVKKIEEHAFDNCPDLVLWVRENSYAHHWCETHDVSWRLLSNLIGIEPGAASLIVQNGETIPAQVTTQPAGLEADLRWSSSDEMICTVSQDGMISGNYPGQAVLTVTSSDSLVSAQISVTVQANYRAVLFSESTFPNEIVRRNRGDVQLMEQMLASVTGPDGGRYSVSSFDDLSADEVYEKIDLLLTAPSRDGDVSLFFFASHGDPRSTTEQYAGRLWCTGLKTWVELPTLARELSKVQGKVIVLLESCGPGAALITFKGSDDETEIIDAPNLTQWMTSVFAAADPGLTVYRPDAGTDSGITGKGTNLFLTDKFIVMTAAGYLQTSYSSPRKTCNLFPAALTDGVGFSGAMPADVKYGNNDGKLTVQELYQYVYENTKTKQTPKVHPENCGEVLFLRAE